MIIYTFTVKLAKPYFDVEKVLGDACDRLIFHDF